MEVLFESQLERSNLFSGKEWKRGYAVLRKHPTTGSKVLEFYKDSHWSKNEPKAVCNLLSSYEATYVVGSTKKRFVFELKTVDHTYELGAPTEALRQQWIGKLNTAKDVLNDSSIQNIVQTFNVVLLDESLVRKHLSGSNGTCQLMITDSEVVVVVAGQVKIRWKFSTVRRYKSQTETFVIEVGRKAPTGEGEFRFDTGNPIELFDVLDKAVKDRIRAKGIEISTLTPTSDAAHSFPSPPSGGGCLHHPASVVSTDTEYSHLDQHVPKSNLPTSRSEYDLLFNKDRFQQKRRSEPVIKPPPFVGSARKLTADSHFSNEHASQSPQGANEDEEMYEDMHASLKHRDAHKPPDVRKPPSTRPLPPPRGGKTGLIAADGAKKSPLKKSLSSPIEENTYEAPNHKHKMGPLQTNNYDSLFNKSVPPPPPPQQKPIEENFYSHLNHGSSSSISRAPLKPTNSNGDVSYDHQPTTKLKGLQPSIRKPVSRPQRPAPVPPGRSTSDGPLPTKPISLSASAGASNELIMQLKKRNIEKGLSKPSGATKDVYDIPNSMTTRDPTVVASSALVGYNVVGGVIVGQYKEINKDADGYVSVPESEPIMEDDIYQVPK